MESLTRALLEDMPREAEAALAAVSGLTNQVIAADAVRSRAIAMSLALIGEAATQMPKDFREGHPSLAWNEARALRNRIIHGYRTVVPDILIETVRVDLPVLIGQIDVLLKDESL